MSVEGGLALQSAFGFYDCVFAQGSVGGVAEGYFKGFLLLGGGFLSGFFLAGMSELLFKSKPPLSQALN